MTVFNGELFLATYAANTQTSGSVPTCNNGTARVWGMDYQIADPTSPPTSGGKGLLNGLPPQASTPLLQFVTPSASTGGTGLGGVVIPGVSIRQSPACASSTAGVNPLGGGAYNSVSNFTPSTYSMFAQLGQANSSGLGANTLNISLNPPIMPMRIDSWAGIFE
jgi:hypothetical protein